MKKTMIIFCLAILFVLIGCGSESSVKPTNEETSFSLRMSRETIPEVVNSIQAQISNGDDAVFTVDFDMDSDPVEAEFTDLQLGTWNLTVSAFDVEDNLVFLGETEVQITHGMNYANVEMNPVSGNLIVNLTWNEDEPIEDNYILVYSVFGDENIFRYHIETGEFIQLTTNGDCKYPEYLKEQEIITYQSTGNYNIYSMDLDGNDVQFYGSFTYSAVDPEYCENNNMYYYYYIGDDGYRNIVAENIITGETLILPGVNYDNARPKPNQNGTEILYISNRTGDWQIYKYSFESEIETQLTSGSLSYCQPMWNNDFSGFYYKDFTTMSIYYYDISSNEITTLVSGIEGEAFYYDVDPDENYIAMNIKNSNGEYNFYIYSLVNGELTQVTESNEFWEYPVWVKK
jgi:hypothetical protein